MTMNTNNYTVNYQPTGVYAQFVKNPALLNQEAVKKNRPPVIYTPPKKEKEIPFAIKAEKFAKKAGIIGAIALVGAGIYYYSKGMKAIKLKEKYFPNVTDETLGRFMNKQYSDDQREFLNNIWSNGDKYLKGRVGKIHNGIQSVRSFFKEYFFNY